VCFTVGALIIVFLRFGTRVSAVTAINFPHRFGDS